MPTCTSSLLASTIPTAVAPAEVTIEHTQLRDLIICPREAGVVNYVQGRSIIEHDLRSPEVVPRPLANLTFNPVTLSSLNLGLSDSSHILLAAGGLNEEIHLSLHSPLHNRALWNFSCELGIEGQINNAVLFSRAYDSTDKPWLVVSNNDRTVRIYDVPLLREPLDLRCCGTVRFEEAVNHSSISPDGRTLLSVGDSPRVYLHSLSGSAQLTFNRTTTLHVPPPISPHPRLISLSTAWSADGLKFAVACQGVIAIWDVRNTKPMKVLYTNRTRDVKDSLLWPGSGSGSGSVSSPRNVKFGGVGGRAGHEIMTYTESTDLLHVLDARTFETEEIICLPDITPPVHPPPEDDWGVLSIAGTCFDPTGGFLYVATMGVVAEWAVHGPGKRRGGRNGQFLERGARSRDVSPLPTWQSNNKGAARYGNDFWGDDTNHTHGYSVPSNPSPRQRKFFDFLRVHHRRINAFQPIPLQRWPWNFDLFASKISTNAIDVAAARDDDRYGIAPLTDAEVAAAMQHVNNSSAQPGQAVAGAPQVTMQEPLTQVAPGKNSVVSTEEASYLVGCCGLYLVRRQSTPHQ